MQSNKLSLADIRNKMNRAELKKITGGNAPAACAEECGKDSDCGKGKKCNEVDCAESPGACTYRCT
jgi:hypothetical protein